MSSRISRWYLSSLAIAASRASSRRAICSRWTRKVERDRLDGDVGDGGGIGREAPAQSVEIGRPAGIELGIDGLRQFGLAGAIVGQCQEPDHRATGLLLGIPSQQRLEGALISAAREELLAIDQVE